MGNSPGADPLALSIQKQASDDRSICLENPRPEGAETSLTENVTSPFRTEPAHFWLSRFIQRVSSSQRLPFTTPRRRPPLRKNSARRTSSMALLACCRTWNLSYTIRQFPAHCSMLLVNGCHISTHAASTRFRCVALSCVRKNSSSVSCLRSGPNHKGSPVSKLLTTVMNFICLPK